MVLPPLDIHAHPPAHPLFTQPVLSPTPSQIICTPILFNQSVFFPHLYSFPPALNQSISLPPLFNPQYHLHHLTNQLFESKNASPHLYWFVVKFFKKKGDPAPKIHRPSIAPGVFAREFAHFQSVFQTKTGVPWAQRLVRAGPAKKSCFRYQAPVGLQVEKRESCAVLIGVGFRLVASLLAGFRQSTCPPRCLTLASRTGVGWR